MKYFAHLTRACIEGARRHGIEAEVNKLARKVESDQSISSWDNFVPHPYVKKSLGRDWRVIARRYQEQDAVVVCFIAVMSRGDREYDDFLEDASTFGEPISPDESTLSKILNKRMAVDPPEPLPYPDDLEYSYLYAQLTNLDDSESKIYESRDWVELIAKADGYQAWCYDLVCEATNVENAGKRILGKNGIQVIYRTYGEGNNLFLVAPVLDRDVAKREELLSKYAKMLEAEAVAEEDLLRVSGRAYPAFVVADSDIWLNIQRNTGANLALSPEESAILTSVTGYASDKVYPLFINGRPGSGKSTLLQYLFAEHLYFHLSREDSDRLAKPPIYLTYSEKLLQWAKAVVKSLLLCNSKLVVQGGEPIREEDLRGAFDTCFGEFHKFLHQLLPVVAVDNFSPQRRVDYPEFRRRWFGKMKSNPDAELRGFSPELVWHVIRTYIKGMRDDQNNYCDPGAYAELPSKQRTVQQETYVKIFEKVWEGWYRQHCEEGGFWDDQDLTRKLLDAIDAGEVQLAQHPVVFCDEAQDFTKIELELILRLSLFSGRSLRPEDLKRVPFAFAGDPFQTLNPTGFDWASVQAGYHEKIVQSLDKSLRGTLKFNYQELNLNYRSTRHIAGFCNFVQLLRGILFGVKDLKPQRTWFGEDAPPPIIFDIDDAACRDKLSEYSELVIILPCQEGEEEQYRTADPFLSQFPPNDIRNFLSPMGAKGLEFSRVVLYKFGDDYLRHYSRLLDPLRTNISHGENPEAALPLEYFINRLYVAASRPKRRLFIVDTREGIDDFWLSDHLRNPTELLRKYPDAAAQEWTVDDLTIIQPGDDESWSTDLDNPAKLAVQFLEEGVSTRDPYKLRLAEANFKRAGQAADALQARAIRLEIEGDLPGAADVYLELKNTSKALRLFWKTTAYDRILDTVAFANSIEHRAASFKLTPLNAQSCLTFLDYLLDEVRGVGRATILGDAHWADLGSELLAAIASLPESAADWTAVYGKFKALASEGFSLPQSSGYAELAFRADDYKAAVAAWDTVGSTSHQHFFLAKAGVEPYPNNLQYLFKAGMYAEVIKAYETNAGSRLGGEADYVSDAYLSLRRHHEALKFLRNHPSRDAMVKLYGSLRAAGDEGLAFGGAKLLLRTLLREADWPAAIDLLERTKWDAEKKARLHAEFVYGAAVSESLPACPIETQNQVADYLKKHSVGAFSHKHISPPIWGAAVERSGRIIDALIYYESFWKVQTTGILPYTDFAKERWLKCKYRQADYSQRQGRVGDAYGQRQDADRYAKSWGINVASLPEYPVLRAEDDPSYLERTPEAEVKASDEQSKAVNVLYGNGFPPSTIADMLKLSLNEVEKILAGQP